MALGHQDSTVAGAGVLGDFGDLGDLGACSTRIPPRPRLCRGGRG